MGVAEVFLLYADYFRMYVMYCNNMDVQGATVQRLRQTNPDFERFVQECKKRPECRLQDISSFLIKPFQRICRYPLLLEAIVRCSEPGPDTDRLKQAAAKIQSVVQRINQQKRQSEANIIAVELQERLYNPDGAVPALISPARKFIRHGLTYEVEPRSCAVVCHTNTKALAQQPTKPSRCVPHNNSKQPSTSCAATCSSARTRASATRASKSPARSTWKTCKSSRSHQTVCGLSPTAPPHVVTDVSSLCVAFPTVVFPRLGWRGSGLCKANSFWLVLTEFDVRILACFLSSEERESWEKEFAEAKSELRKVYTSNIPLEPDMDEFEVIRKSSGDDDSQID